MSGGSAARSSGSTGGPGGSDARPPAGVSGSVRARQRPEVRRAMIVAAAREVIVRRGVGSTGLRDIAAEAGVSVGTVTYHFGSVAEILNEVVVLETERFYGAIVDAVDAEPDPVKAVRMLVDPLFAEREEVRQHWRIWSDYWTAVVRRPEVAAEYAERIRVWEACLVRAVRRGVDAGVFTPSAEPEVVALKLAAYSDGVATQIQQGVPGLTNAVALEWMWGFLEHELGEPLAGSEPAPLVRR